MKRFSRSREPRHDRRLMKQSRWLHPQSHVMVLDIGFNIRDGGGYVAIQNIAKHSPVANNVGILSAHEPHHSMHHLIRTAWSFLAVSHHVQSFAFQTEINRLAWCSRQPRRKEHDVEPAKLLSRCGIQFDHLSVNIEWEIPDRPVAMQRTAQQLCNMIFFVVDKRSRYRAPGLQSQP